MGDSIFSSFITFTGVPLVPLLTNKLSLLHLANLLWIWLTETVLQQHRHFPPSLARTRNSLTRRESCRRLKQCPYDFQVSTEILIGFTTSYMNIVSKSVFPHAQHHVGRALVVIANLSDYFHIRYVNSPYYAFRSS